MSNDNSKAGRPHHVLVVMGEGGHSKQCLRLIELLGTTEYRYSYLLVDEDRVTEHKIRVPGRVVRVVRPGGVKYSKLDRLLKLPLCSIQAGIALLRLRPDVVLSTGPGVAVPVSVLGKLMGASIVYVESCSRVRTLSATGRVMTYIADLYFVQWEELRSRVPTAVFAGRLF